MAKIIFIGRKYDGLNSNYSEYIKKALTDFDDLSVNKEYMITFEKGGWNTIYATNDEDALAKAKEKYDGPHTKVESVRVSSSSMKEAAMRNFY